MKPNLPLPCTNAGTSASIAPQRRRAPLVVLGLLLALPGLAQAQSRTRDQAPHRGIPPFEGGADEQSALRKGLESSFALPLHKLRDGTAPHQLSLRLGLEVPLKSNALSGAGFRSQGDIPSSPTAQLGLRYMPLEGWFVRMNALRYLSPERQRPWNPDFTYSFGYEDWRPYTLSLVYTNDGGNRFNPDRSLGERVTRFDEGTWTFGFKFPLPKSLEPVFLLPDEEDAVGCSTSWKYTHRYTDIEAGARQHGKHSATFGCRYTFRQRWFVSGTLHGFPNSRQKQPWDPDFTYSFGYADYRSGGLVAQYANDSGNRLPGNPRAPGTGRFRDGSVSIAWSVTF
ncbi:hypothetical protein [Caldimonas tepidiphila]|uniref:hypothetical protein n=1 Tax=Caldimonas tepidiphila TaxID=2315841 RepID=UPI000E5C5652|nr:hypothetical protein [Caldimonas tepidiphila]